MSDLGAAPPHSIPKPAAEQHKPARKAQPAMFPNRITFCMADDQVANLQEVKRAFRASEAFVLRMAFDVYCRTNGFVSNGGTNVR
jgi:hypothetical protein